MKIIIPMSGIGKRFIDAGYERPKPLIKVNGKPIIEYVISMFPGDHDFIFICNREHLDNTDMWSVLKSIKPESRIVSIVPQNKGPVSATTEVFDEIDDEEDLMISYCDYFMEWDFNDFQQKVKSGEFSGAVPCYTGFHPHLLHRNLYAGVNVGADSVMEDIKEKHSFTENPMDGFHSPGAYYFRCGADFKKYSTELLDSEINLNGEVYTSMLYYLYLRDGHKIYVPEVKRFIQLGTPEDLEEFEAWSRYFHKKLVREKLLTDIPEIREHRITIQTPEESEDFRKIHNYWEPYFINTL
jgi:NDP-sugar pyrophosphorylase family protein